MGQEEKVRENGRCPAHGHRVVPFPARDRSVQVYLHLSKGVLDLALLLGLSRVTTGCRAPSWPFSMRWDPAPV